MLSARDRDGGDDLMPSARQETEHIQGVGVTLRFAQNPSVSVNDGVGGEDDRIGMARGSCLELFERQLSSVGVRILTRLWPALVDVRGIDLKRLDKRSQYSAASR